MFSTSSISSVITSIAIIVAAFVFLMCTYANWGEDSFVIGIVLIVVYAIVHFSAMVYHAYSDAIHSIAWKANEAFVELDRVSSILPPFATQKERNFVVLLFLSFISTFSYLIDLQYGYYMYAVPQLFAIFLYVVTVTFSTKYVVALEGLMFIVSQRLTSILPYVTHWNDSRLETLAKFTIWDLTPIIFTSASVANIYTIILVIFILRRIRLLSRVRFIIVYPMMMFLREIIVLVTLIPCRVTVDTCSDNMFSGHVFTIVYLSLGLRNSFCVWVPYVAYFSLTGFHYTSDILVAIVLAFLVHSHKFAMVERYLSIMFGQVWELDFHVDCICNICYWDKVESGQLITDPSKDGDDHSPHLVALEQEQFAYKEFRTKHPEDKVSFTSFVKHTLRPLMRYERLDNLYDCTGNVVAKFSYPYNSKLDGVYHGSEGHFNRKLYEKAYVPKGEQIKGVALIEVTVDDEQLHVSEPSSGESSESSSLCSNDVSENALFE